MTSPTASADNRIIVLGAGGHAKSVIGVLRAEARWRVVGLLTESATDAAATVLGHPVIGHLSDLAQLRASGVGRAFVAIGDNLARRRLSEHLVAAGFELVSVIHPSAVVQPDAELGPGSFLHAMTIVGPECRIGRSAIVQPFTSLGHESRIGDYAQFSPGVHIGGRVRIGDGCFFGPGAVVHPRVNLGANVSVGANSVVNRDVADDCTVLGNPARRRGGADSTA